MKKVLVAILLFMIIALPAAFAEFRLDIALDVPARAGVVLDSFSSGGDESFSVLSEFVFLMPEVTAGFQGSFGPVNVGAGLRMFTLILESLAWPVVYAELDFDRLAIYANVGGGGFLFFGLINQVETAELIIPDISAWFKFNDAFRVGVGALALAGPAFESAEITPYIVYLSGRWSLTF